MKSISTFLFFLLLYSFSQTYGQIPFISYSNQPLQITDIQPVEVSININNIANLFSASLVIQYDKEYLKIDEITQGDFLTNNPDNDNVFFEYSPKLNVDSDTIQIDQSILGSSMVNGSGSILKLKIMAKKNGNTILKIKLVRFRDNENNPIEVTANNLIINSVLPLVKPKVMLEGAYNSSTGKMNVNLKSILPLSQPFNSAPFNYSGNESVAEDFFELENNIVDWVLLELRSGLSSATIVSRRAAFLLDNGEIVDIDGKNPVYFNNTVPGDYYLVIKQRNHLAIMSNTAYSFNILSSYDFTSNSSLVYGTNPMKEVSTGVYAMISGDANSDGFITNGDYDIFKPLYRNVSKGYLNSDFNLDSFITNKDFDYLNPNFKKIYFTQVPN